MRGDPAYVSRSKPGRRAIHEHWPIFLVNHVGRLLPFGNGGRFRLHPPDHNGRPGLHDSGCTWRWSRRAEKLHQFGQGAGIESERLVRGPRLVYDLGGGGALLTQAERSKDRAPHKES